MIPAWDEQQCHCEGQALQLSLMVCLAHSLPSRGQRRETQEPAWLQETWGAHVQWLAWHACSHDCELAQAKLTERRGSAELCPQKQDELPAEGCAWALALAVAELAVVAFAEAVAELLEEPLVDLLAELTVVALAEAFAELLEALLAELLEKLLAELLAKPHAELPVELLQELLAELPALASAEAFAELLAEAVAKLPPELPVLATVY